MVYNKIHQVKKYWPLAEKVDEKVPLLSDNYYCVQYLGKTVIEVRLLEINISWV